MDQTVPLVSAGETMVVKGYGWREGGEKMRLAGLVGSRRKRGNTRTLVEKALAGAQREGAEIDLILLGEYDIRPCTGCQGCQGKLRCVQEDDLEEVLARMLAADGVVMGSPAYFYNITADLKAFLDRTYSITAFHPQDRSVWTAVPEVMGGNYAVLVGVCEQSAEEGMGLTMEAMALPLQALGYRLVEQLPVSGHFAAGAVQEDQGALERAGAAGARLARTVKLRQDTIKRWQERSSRT